MKIDLNTWEEIKEEAQKTTDMDPQEMQEEAQDEPGEDISQEVDDYIPEPPLVVEVAIPMGPEVLVLTTDPVVEPEDLPEAVPELMIIVSHPVMLISAVAVTQGEGKDKKDLFEIDLKMRVLASDLANIAGKLSGHVCMAIFKRMDETGEL